jgi:hypothetical protein
MSVDEKLLANQQEQADDKVATFNETTSQARIKKKEEEIKKKKKKEKSQALKKINPIALSTAKWFRISVLNMLAWFFLPVIYLDIHFLGNYLGSKKMFLSVGEVWFARPGKTIKKVEIEGKKAQLPTELGCACINIGCLLLLIAALALMAFLFCAAFPTACVWVFIKEWASDIFNKLSSFFRVD